ncbi:MAG: type II secretion system major pseudopilin GspG [Planctomycetota bacterium]
MKTHPKLKNAARAGFTLAEIMVVIVIIGLLAAYVAPRMFSNVDRAKVTTAKQQMTGLLDAVNQYRMNNSQWPEDLEQLTEEDERGNSYYDKIPADPWGGEYQLENMDGDPVIICLGADNQQGGEEKDSDFSVPAEALAN